MPSFNLELSRIPSDASWSLSCSIIGEHNGFTSLERTLISEMEMIEALKGAGIADERIELATRQAQNNPRVSIEISQNEAQKLSVLHTDTSE